MDALNHADQMRLANLISDNLDDAEIQKKLDQVVELTSSTRDQAAVALHDCHYDVGKAVDMILEGDHANVENQWKSAGKKKNKNVSSQATTGGSKQHPSAGGKSLAARGAASTGTGAPLTSTSASNTTTAPHHSGSSSSNTNSHLQQSSTTQQQHHHNQFHNNNKFNSSATAIGGGNHHHQQQPQTSLNNNNQFNAGSKQDATIDTVLGSGKPLGLTGAPNLKSSSELQAVNSSATSAAASSIVSDTHHHHHHHQQQHNNQHHQQPTHPHQQQQHQQRSNRPTSHGAQQNHRHQHHQRSTRIPESAVEMPNNELHVSTLNVQFGELDLRDGGNAGASDMRGTFHNVLDSNALGGTSGVGHKQAPSGPHNSHHSSNPTSTTTTIPQTNQDGNTSRQQQHLAKSGGPRRSYNSNPNSSNTNDDRRFYNNSSRGGRQISGGNQRPYNSQRGPSVPMGAANTGGNVGNSRGVRTILNRGLQPNSTLPGGTVGGPSNQANNSGFPNSIDTWTNSTAEAVNKKPNPEPAVASLRVGQWSDVAGTEDWSEEDWEAKVMETKVFTPSTKSVDGSVSNQKIQPLLTDSSVPAQIIASKLSESIRDDVSSQQNTLNPVTSQNHSQQSPQKPLSHMNDIFDASVAKAVLEQQNLASIKPKSSISMGQYNKDSADAKTVLDQQNLNSIKPKAAMTMNQYSKEASESLKSLVGISSNSKGNVPSVPPGALPIMSQPQYIMGNAYQPAIFPYAYQTPDVHYQVAAQTTGREQNFQSVYSPNDANKFNRGTDGDTPAINTTQAAPVASQTHNQAFVANALHAGYQLTYAMPGAFNMMPQNLYSAAPIFPHLPQPTNTGSANSVYQKNTATSYQHHSGYSAYDQLNPLIQDYVKLQQQNYPTASMQHQQQQPTNKASASNSELDVISEGNSYNMYGTMSKSQPQVNKQANYSESKGYQQQISNNGPQQQFGLSHNAQQPSSMTNYPLLQAHNLDGSSLNSQNNTQHQLQHLHQHANARSGTQVNQSKYYPSWN